MELMEWKSMTKLHCATQSKRFTEKRVQCELSAYSIRAVLRIHGSLEAGLAQRFCLALCPHVTMKTGPVNPIAQPGPWPFSTLFTEGATP